MDTIDSIQRSYAATVADLQCSRHYRSAQVVVDGNGVDDLEVEIFCCCDGFRQQVRQALPVPNQSGSPGL